MNWFVLTSLLMPVRSVSWWARRDLARRYGRPVTHGEPPLHPNIWHGPRESQLLFKKLFEVFLILCVCMCAHVHKCRCQEKQTSEISLVLGLQVTVFCLMCWGPKVGPLQKQHALFTAAPSLQTFCFFSVIILSEQGGWVDLSVSWLLYPVPLKMYTR